MPLETATFIDGLDSANPAATDLLSQGDDHIRLIKAVLKATFPNITGAVTLTEDELNGLSSLIAGGGVPTGTVAMWYGASADCPDGWGICDGSTYPKVDLSGNIVSPDLRDKVVIGVGALQATVGGAYGATTQSATTGSAGAHSHTISGDGTHSHNPTIAGHALTIGEMPAHDHTIGGNPGSGGGSLMQTSGGTATTIHVSSTGSGQAHTHGISFSGSDGSHTHTMSGGEGAHTHSVSVDVHQPSVALHYIIKL